MPGWMATLRLGSVLPVGRVLVVVLCSVGALARGSGALSCATRVATVALGVLSSMALRTAATTAAAGLDLMMGRWVRLPRGVTW